MKKLNPARLLERRLPKGSKPLRVKHGPPLEEDLEDLYSVYARKNEKEYCALRSGCLTFAFKARMRYLPCERCSNYRQEPRETTLLKSSAGWAAMEGEDE